MTAVRIVLSLALPLAFGLAPRQAAVISTRAIAIVLAAGAALITAGSIAGSVPLAVSDLTVTIAALGGGVLLGRALPPRPRVMVIFLAACSAADIIQNALISGGPSTASRPAVAAAAWRAYTVLRIAVPGGHYDIGPLDLLLFTAIGEHWRRRGGGWVQSAGPGILGMGLADLVPISVSLPLIPFVLTGWLTVEGITQRTRKSPHTEARHAAHRRAPPAE